MPGSKDEAQRDYAEKKAADEEATSELLDARRELDEHLFEESVERHRVFIDDGSLTEDGIERAIEDFRAAHRNRVARLEEMEVS